MRNRFFSTAISLAALSWATGGLLYAQSEMPHPITDAEYKLIADHLSPIFKSDEVSTFMNGESDAGHPCTMHWIRQRSEWLNREPMTGRDRKIYEPGKLLFFASLYDTEQQGVMAADQVFRIGPRQLDEPYQFTEYFSVFASATSLSITERNRFQDQLSTIMKFSEDGRLRSFHLVVQSHERPGRLELLGCTFR